MDRHLSGLNQQLIQSAQVLDELAAIQAQFEDLAQTYQAFKQYSDRLQSHESGLTADLDDFRTKTEQRCEALEVHLGEIQRSFSGIQETFEDPREAVQIYIETLEGRLRAELRGALSRIEQAGFSPAQLEKVEKLDIQVRGMRTALRNAERQGRLLQNWLVAVTLLAITALGLPLLMPLIVGEPQSTSLLQGTANPPATPGRRAAFGEGDLGGDP